MAKSKFDVFLVRNLKTQGKVIESFRRLFELNFEDEGATSSFLQNVHFSSVYGDARIFVKENCYSFEKELHFNWKYIKDTESNQIQIQYLWKKSKKSCFVFSGGENLRCHTFKPGDPNRSSIRVFCLLEGRSTQRYLGLKFHLTHWCQTI